MPTLLATQKRSRSWSAAPRRSEFPRQRHDRDFDHQIVARNPLVAGLFIFAFDGGPSRAMGELLALRRTAIGVIYRSETGMASHDFRANLPQHFDEYIWFDNTSASNPVQYRRSEGASRRSSFWGVSRSVNEVQCVRKTSKDLLPSGRPTRSKLSLRGPWRQ